MKNRDSNENIYRNMEKPYLLLQVHIFFSFHTLYILFTKTDAKIMFFPQFRKFSSQNVKSYLIIRFFVVNIWVIRKFVVSLHCLKEIMI